MLLLRADDDGQGFKLCRLWERTDPIQFWRRRIDVAGCDVMLPDRLKRGGVCWF